MTLNGCGCKNHGGSEAREAWLITNRIGLVRADHWFEGIEDMRNRVIEADAEYPVGQLVASGFGVDAIRIRLLPDWPQATETPFYHRYRVI